MKYIEGNVFSRVFYSNASVLFFEDTDEEVEIDCTIIEEWDENSDFEVDEIVVVNPEDIPEGYTEEDVVDFVKEKFES